MNDNQPPQDLPQSHRKLRLREYTLILVLIAVVILVAIALLTPAIGVPYSNIINEL